MSSAPDTADHELKPTTSEEEATATTTTKESTKIDVPAKAGDADDSKSISSSSGEEKKDEEEEQPTVSISELFQYADNTDMWLMGVGSFIGFCNGAGMPAFSEIFGRMITELLKPGGDLEGTMSELAGILCIIGAVVFVLSWVQVTTFTIAAERQARRIRERYFEATLRQELGFHDEQKPGGLSARLFGDITVLRNGINDKLGVAGWTSVCSSSVSVLVSTTLGD